MVFTLLLLVFLWIYQQFWGMIVTTSRWRFRGFVIHTFHPPHRLSNVVHFLFYRCGWVEPPASSSLSFCLLDFLFCIWYGFFGGSLWSFYWGCVKFLVHLVWWYGLPFGTKAMTWLALCSSFLRDPGGCDGDCWSTANSRGFDVIHSGSHIYRVGWRWIWW